MVKLQYRSDVKELIDGRQIDAPILQETYRQIKRINTCTLGYWPTMSAVKYFLSRYGQGREISVLDVGCGDGETLRRIGIWGRVNGFSLRLIGIDLNKDIIDAARRLSDDGGIEFIDGNVFSSDHNKVYDLIISSLTMHHLENEKIIQLFRWMSDHTRWGWFVADLHRNKMAYYFIKYFSRFCRFNPLICHDAPLSVARSFRRQELLHLLTQAELDLDFTQISWYPNFRYGIRYEKLL